jgi:hypothetical protein
VEEILSGKSYKHLTLQELRLSATNRCPFCAFLFQHVSSALRRSLGPSEVLQIFLEQHSSQYRFTRQETKENRDEVHKLNAEDDEFRDAMIGVQSGYASTMMAVIGRPVVDPPLEATVAQREVCYVTLEYCTDSGSAVVNFCGKICAD